MEKAGAPYFGPLPAVELLCSASFMGDSGFVMFGFHPGVLLLPLDQPDKLGIDEGISVIKDGNSHPDWFEFHFRVDFYRIVHANQELVDEHGQGQDASSCNQEEKPFSSFCEQLEVLGQQSVKGGSKEADQDDAELYGAGHPEQVHQLVEDLELPFFGEQLFQHWLQVGKGDVPVTLGPAYSLFDADFKIVGLFIIDAHKMVPEHAAVVLDDFHFQLKVFSERVEPEAAMLHQVIEPDDEACAANRVWQAKAVFGQLEKSVGDIVAHRIAERQAAG